MPELAPTREMLADYRKRRIDWETYESQFMDLIQQRRIEDTVFKDIVTDGCLLCSEDKPHKCHRRLVAEYLKHHWGNVEIVHLGHNDTLDSRRGAARRWWRKGESSRLISAPAALRALASRT